jgi:hypothetical protein
VQQVEDAWIIVVDIAGSMVAQVMIKLIKRSSNVLVAPAIYDVQPLAGVGMEKPQPVFLEVIAGRAVGRRCGQKNHGQRKRWKPSFDLPLFDFRKEAF